jgi:hypothetical protein
MLMQDNQRQKMGDQFNFSNPEMEGVNQEIRGLDGQIEDITRQIEEYENIN